MSKTKITSEQIEFITDTVFDIARLIMGEHEKDLPNPYVNNMIVNVTMSNGTVTGMFLEGQEYLMTVDKEALIHIN